MQGTEWARTQIWTFRSKLLKIGALVKTGVRRVFFEISEHYPKSSSRRCSRIYRWPVLRGLEQLRRKGGDLRSAECKSRCAIRPRGLLAAGPAICRSS
ncbi:MAG: hypothetical protein ABEL51_11375 [Salinibacter sp.]